MAILYEKELPQSYLQTDNILTATPQGCKIPRTHQETDRGAEIIPTESVIVGLWNTLLDPDKEHLKLHVYQEWDLVVLESVL